MNKIHDISFLELVPQSIKEDATIASSALALDDLLKKTVLSIPNLLIYSRLGGHDTNTMLAPLARLTHARGGLKPLSLAELEQLAWQMHVDFREVAKTEGELAQMVRQSISWHRIKGTPRSITNALDLFGYKASVEENTRGMHWATYQLNLGDSIANNEEVRHIVSIAKEMAPVRCKLFRMYNNTYDIRPMIWGVTPWAHGIYSNFSGVTLPDIDKDLIISLGHRLGITGVPYSEGFAALSGNQHFSFLISWPYHPIWGVSKWGEVYPKNYGFQSNTSHSIEIPRKFGELIYQDYRWDKTWDYRQWQGVLGRKDETWNIVPKGIAKSCIVSGFASNDCGLRASLYGGLNANYATPIYNILPPAPIFGQALYGFSQEKINIFTVLEQKQEFYKREIFFNAGIKLDSIGMEKATFVGKNNIAYGEKSFWQQYNAEISVEMENSVHIMSLSHASVTTPEKQNTAEFAEMNLKGSEVKFSYDETWTGAWNRRKWWPYFAQTRISTSNL